MTTPRDRLTGLAALVGLLLVLVGTPAVLLAIGAAPFPNGVPSWDQAWSALTGVDDGTAILTLLRLAAWAAWAYLALGVILELIARARGIRAPRIRGLGLSQNAAHALVSAALLAFTALPALSTGAAAAPALVAVTTLEPAPAPAAQANRAGDDGTRAAAVVEDAPGALTHTVRPGDTLWGIAERYLGDGARFLEIANANYHAPQSDGRTLTSSHRIHPGWRLQVPTTAPGAADAATAGGVQQYTVRAGDTLWDIAETHLGEATRYGEIFTASTAITQPGGHRLSDPDEISPGWTLHIPTVLSDAAGSSPGEPTPETDPVPAEDSAAAAAAAPADPEPVPNPPAADAAGTGTAGRDTAPAHEGEDASAGAGADTVGSDDGEQDVGGWPVRTTAGVGSLLAAGVIALLTAHRAMQARRRRHGLALPMPTGPAAATEVELRATADGFGIVAVDTALRTLAHACAAAGQPLPVLRYARLTGGQLDLHLSEPAHLPQPWSGTTDATVWTLRVQDADLLDPATAASIPAPYPALVTVGHDSDDAHVFLDLEQVGSLAVVGDDDDTRDILAGLTVELATSAWADDLQVTVVGAFPELEDALRTGRIRYLPAAGRLLDELSTRAEADRAALAESGAVDLQQARVSDAAPDAWHPEIVLLATPLPARQRHQLNTILEGLPRVAVAAVITGDGPGHWALTLSDEHDDAVLEPLGIRLQPQRIDRTAYRDLLDLVSLAGTEPAQPYPTGGHRERDQLHHPAAGQEAAASPDDDGQGRRSLPDGDGAGQAVLPDPSGQGPVDLPAGSGQGRADSHGVGGQGAQGVPNSAEAPGVDVTEVSDHGASGTGPAVAEDGPRENEVADAPPGDAVAQVEDNRTPGDGEEWPAPSIRLLGPVVVEHACGRIDQSHKQRAVEFAAFLALHPGASSAALEEALWPGRRATNTRYTLTSKLRTWLGATPDGQDYLPKYQPTSRFVLHDAVRSDWDRWCALLPDGPLPAPIERLEEALALVRGRPFENAPSNYYAWAEPDRARMVAEIADAACELARRRAHTGDWRGAEEAALSGLAIDPSLERLWRVRILAAHATRSEQAGQDAIDRMLTIAGDLGADIEAETTALLDGIRTDTDPRLLLAVAL